MKAEKTVIRKYYKILQEQNTDSYVYTIPSAGLYLVELVGAGGGGAQKYADNAGGSGSGGSGGYFKGILNLNSGDELSFTFGVGGVGKVQTTYGEVTATAGTESTLSINGVLTITTNGGDGGNSNAKASCGQTTINDDSKIIEVISTTGVNGSYLRGGALSRPTVERTLSPLTKTTTGYGSGGGYNTTDGAGTGANGAMRISNAYEDMPSDYDYYEDKELYRLVKIDENYYAIGG